MSFDVRLARLERIIVPTSPIDQEARRWRTMDDRAFLKIFNETLAQYTPEQLAEVSPDLPELVARTRVLACDTLEGN